MPLIQRRAAQSSQGFGQFAAQTGNVAPGNYVENNFSTYLYTGNGTSQIINTGVGLTNTAAWSTYKIDQTSININNQICDDNNFFLLTETGSSATLTANNANGQIIWQRKYTNSFGGATGLVKDYNSNIIIADDNNGPVQFETVKYNSSGSLQWKQRLQTPSGTSPGLKALACDTNNNIYGVGWYRDTNYYGIIYKYNSLGTFQWINAFRTNPYLIFNSVAIDNSSNIVVAGVSSVGANIGFLGKFDSNGNLIWSTTYQISTTAVFKSVAIDSSDNIYVAGVPTGVGPVCLLKYNSSGTLLWQRFFIGTNTSYSPSDVSICVDSNSNVYVAADLLDSISTNKYVGVLKYNSSGVLQWQLKIFGSYSYITDRPIISVSANGNLYVSVRTNTTGTDYPCMIKLQSDGTTLSGSAYVTIFSGTATDSAGTGTVSTPSVSTISTSSFSDSAATGTDAAGALSYTTFNQNAVTDSGGLVWIKSRSDAVAHNLFDTVSGATNALQSNDTGLLQTDTTSLTSFFADGFTLGANSSTNVQVNKNTSTYVAWSFRKKTKFFDIVTYTGNGANRTISHNLGSAPGFIIVKSTTLAGTDWAVYHKNLTSAAYYLRLNTSNSQVSDTTYWNSTAPSDTEFSVGTNSNVNQNGQTYVAYLFASDAGGFGAGSNQNTITCGSYVGNGAASGPSISLGYEPQWVLVKKMIGSSTTAWRIEDNLRGISQFFSNFLAPDSTVAETALNPGVIPNATGFSIGTNNTVFNTNGDTYIYVAVRRGPMAQPTNATDVFVPALRTGTGAAGSSTALGNVLDLVITKKRAGTGGQWAWTDRLRGQTYELASDASSAETAYVEDVTSFASMSGFSFGTGNLGYVNTSAANYVDYLFQRAPGFFDIVCYTGNGVDGATYNHNLNAVPELMIVKYRSGATTGWPVYAAPLGNTADLQLNSQAQASYSNNYWNNTTPTSTVFTLSKDQAVNKNGTTYVAYLFASVPGIIKIGSYNGNGSTGQTIDCGFTSGARFVVIKCHDNGATNWRVYDTARGMAAGTDPYVLFNSNNAEVNANAVYSTATGFQLIGSNSETNNASNSYIYMAIA